MRTNWKRRGCVAVCAGVLALTQAASAELITQYTYDGKNISVITLNNWNNAPSGASMIQQNQSFSGTWTVPAGITSVELLVVGGGAGGKQWLSGAGAGGFYSNGNYTVTPGGGVAVAIGAGGLGYGDGTTTGIQGSSSVFGSVIAYGGTVSLSSPEGGAQGGYSTDGGSTVTPGNPGVINTYGYLFASGSGAGAIGTPDNNSAAGGAGLSSFITGSLQWYAGGGGGPVTGPGGSGVGGTGAAAIWGPSGDAVANTGSGGGGSWGGVHGAGSSGVVIVAYAIPEPASGMLLFSAAVVMGLIRRKIRG